MAAIKILKRKQVNEKKWNALIEHSAFSLPYAYTWYLDALDENWEALVLNDYEAVMPLFQTRKFGFKCLYQPYYCQQLGVFAPDSLKTADMKEILLAAQKFAYININLNPSAKAVADEFSLTPKKNLLLDLSKSYNDIRKNYSENHRRNIAKAEKSKLEFSEHTELKQFQKFYLENINRDKENFKPRHEKLFKGLMKTVTANGTGKIFTAQTTGGKFLAAVVLLFHQKRIICIVNSSSAEGKKSGASHFLFDKIIQKFSVEPVVLDFEGSSVPTIARFYEGFGAREEVFYNYYWTIVKGLRSRFAI